VSQVDGGDECSTEDSGGSSSSQGGRRTGMVSRREFVACRPSRIAKAFPR
jgi:hypothetical protein